MIDITTTWREWLYLPLGVIPSLFFGLRILVQWYQSERSRTSYAGALFWRLSLCGNVALFLHFFVQIQFPFAIIQALNALISWRNLDLITSTPPHKKKFALGLLPVVLIAVVLLFALQGYLCFGELDWIRTPKKPWEQVRSYNSWLLHLFGTCGGIILSCRFWLQWWQTELKSKSIFSANFWYLSMVGSAMQLAYALAIGDIVLLYYNLFSFIPYMRNLLLIKRQTI